jgi:hypothetical protein
MTENDQQRPDAVGERIVAILNEAEQTADRIREEARAEASAIIREAHERAAGRVEELTREPERIKAEAVSEADRIRADAEAYSADSRRKAEDAVRAIEDDGRAKQRDIAAQIRALEGVRAEAMDAVRTLAAGQRDAAARLEGAARMVAPEAAEARPATGLRRLFARPQNGASATNGALPSDDLQDRARELNIRGRTKMSRDELEDAVRRAAGE